MWRRWGTPQNFFLAFIDELEKQIIIKKLLKWANKKQIILIFTMLHFFNKNNTCGYHDQNLDMFYSSWDIEHNKLKLVILGHFLPFIPLKTLKIQNFEKWKSDEYIIILYMCTKNHNHMMYSSWNTEWERQKNLSFWAIFCPFTSPLPPLMIPNIKILKRMKKMPGDIILL